MYCCMNFSTCLIGRYYSDAEEYDENEIFESSEEESTNPLKCHGQKVLTMDTWSDISPKIVDNIPCDTDGHFVFVVKNRNNTKLQERYKDGHSWQQNSSTK